MRGKFEDQGGLFSYVSPEAKAKVKEAGGRITVGEDKAYDTADHVAKLREMSITPHVAQYNLGNPSGRQSAIDGRTTRHPGYGMSQTCRAMAECIFGWGKQHGTMRKTKHRGCARVLGDFLLNLIAYNLVRIPQAHYGSRPPIGAAVTAPTLHS